MLSPMINIYMKDVYTNAFYDIVRETQDTHGYELPVHLESYVVMLLANYVERPNFLPSNSFAESYLNLNKRMDAKTLGDTCLFVSGVFPNYGKKNGLGKDYYVNIGQGSYGSMYGQLFEELSVHFNFLSEFIELSTSSPKHELNKVFL
jgi:hypothetical protein